MTLPNCLTVMSVAAMHISQLAGGQPACQTFKRAFKLTFIEVCVSNARVQAASDVWIAQSAF